MNTPRAFPSHLLVESENISSLHDSIYFIPLFSAINNNRAKCVSLFLCRRGRPLGAAYVGKRPRKPGQHLIKKFLKQEPAGRSIEAVGKQTRCLPVPSTSCTIFFLLFNALHGSERRLTQMAKTGGKDKTS
jgi:hypothetical protein